MTARLEAAFTGVARGRALALRFRLGSEAGGDAVAADGDRPSGARGSLSKSAIREVIANRLHEVRFCYEDGLEGWPQLQGSVAIKFTIQPDGSVARVSIANTTLANGPVECCIRNSLTRWRFPPPEGGGIVIVTYPFVLEQTF